MTWERAIPFVIIALMFTACIPYFWIGDWRRGTYWLAAAVLNLAITL